MGQQRGFTYIELMIVAAIIAILVAIAVPSFLEARVRATVSRSRAELAVVKMAIEAYRTENRIYPQNKEKGIAGSADLLVLTTPVPYLSSLPLDPFTLNETRGRHQVPMQPLTFRYLNGFQANPAEGLKIEPGNTDYLPGYMGGIIWGFGPAGTLPVSASSYFIRILPENQITIRTYDPTNGTTSKGDIYQTFP